MDAGEIGAIRMKIVQGHKYDHYGREVLALESGTGAVQVAPIDYLQPYPLGKAQTARAEHLIALPMRYFHGEVPA